MTQVQAMTDQQINRALAELMGWTEFKEDGHGGMWAVAPDYRWTNKMPDYCNSPASSLEVQTAAIAVNKLVYLNALLSLVSPGDDIEFGLGGTMEVVGYNIDGTSAMLTATPRQRAEAAYITLSQVRE